MIPFKINLKKLKFNYFSNKIDSFLTIFFSTGILSILISLLNWAIYNAQWNVISQNINVIAYGLYPTSETWRPLTWLIVLLILTLMTFAGISNTLYLKYLRVLWAIQLPLGTLLLAGGFGLNQIESRSWGGITLTLVLTISSAIASLFIGIILALARESTIKSIRLFCITYIDTVRAFPLITVLFFGQLLIPLFLPMDLEINRVARAIIAFSLFTSAYIAEDIRGGLQSIPPAQREAAEVLGFNKREIIQIVLLPQALKTAIPALTNQLIGLLQNTSLMAILGLVEIMGIGRSILANPEFIGRYLEVYICLALIYWFLCTTIALISYNLEKKINLNLINN